MSVRKKLKNTCLLIVMLVSILIASIPIFPVEASEYTKEDLKAQINLALDWLDRFSYMEINSTHAVATDTPQLSFRIKDNNDGKWIMSGKHTHRLDKNLPPGANATVKGGGYVIDADTKLNLITDFVDNAYMKYVFDVDGDNDYDDVELYVEYATINDTWTELAGKVLSVQDSSWDLTLYIETTVLIDHVDDGDTFDVKKEWGWKGSRYTIRPTVKGLADLYYNIRNHPDFGSSARGVNYTDRALKLYRTWYESGYIIDRFDGHYGTCVKTRPFPEIAKYKGQGDTIPPNPDLIAEPYRGFNNGSDVCYYVGSPLAHWYNYSNYERPEHTLLRFATCSRHVMPENEEWVNVPFICTDDCYVFPYKSRTGFQGARNTYINNGFEFDLIHYNNYPTPLPGIDLILGIGTDAKSIRACHDLYKYGKDVPYGLETLKQEFIDSATWDGNGIAFDSWHDTPIGWDYPAYGAHNTATYGNALIQYWYVSGDDWYATRADEVVGVLLMLQNKLGEPRYSRSFNRDFYRAEYVGAIVPGYAVAYSFGQQNIYTAGWIEMIYGFLRALQYIPILNQYGFQEDPQPFTYPCLGNTECTIPAVWTLIEYYDKLFGVNGHKPKLPTGVDYVLPFDNVVVYADHGGSLGGDGGYEILSDNVQKTHIGGETGNLYKYQGKVDRIRLCATGGAVGEGWVNLTYVWNFTLDSAVSNWRAKTYFTIPDLYGVVTAGGNSLTVWIELYDSSNTLVFSQKNITLDGYTGSTETGLGGKVCLIEAPADQTDWLSLSAGAYTIKLTFYVHAGGNALLGLGYTSSGGGAVMVSGLPMGLEYFGYDCDPVDPPASTSTVTHKLNIQCVGNGTVNYPINEWWTETLDGWTEESIGTVSLSTFRIAGNYSIEDVPAFSGDFRYAILERRGFSVNLNGGSLHFSVYVTASVSATIYVYTKPPLYPKGWYKGISVTPNVWNNITVHSSDSDWIPVNGGGDWSNITDVIFWFSKTSGYTVYLDNLTLKTTFIEGEIVSVEATPDAGNYFWFWIINNTRLGVEYYCPLEILELPVDHDYNVTAYFGDVSYTMKCDYPLTIKGDINMDGKVDIKDILHIAKLYGKNNNNPDWISSLAYPIDLLIKPDGKIDIKDLLVTALHFGDEP